MACAQQPHGARPLRDSVDLTVPQITAALDAAEAGASLLQVTKPLRKAIHYLTVGVEP